MVTYKEDIINKLMIGGEKSISQIRQLVKPDNKFMGLIEYKSVKNKKEA